MSGLALGNSVVLVCGSFARREASEYSDADYFMISDNGVGKPDIMNSVEEAIQAVVQKGPSPTGAFGQAENRSALLQNIGGDDDTNKNITRRVLFLLEGEWLHNPSGLRDFRREILNKYIPQSISDHQLALFLLNDVIRYYRTIAVDYEFKISEGTNTKPWAIRNIKLVFSRKLLYASGLFSIAMTADRTAKDKVKILDELFALPAVERMKEICGEARMESVLRSYNVFLETLEQDASREHLESLSDDGRSDMRFRSIKNEGHHFNRAMFQLFEDTFDATHPIHRAVVF